MHVEMMQLLRCPSCGTGFAAASGAAALRIFTGERDARGEHVLDGALVCRKCGTWARIEGAIADLRPPDLRDCERDVVFAARYGLEAPNPAPARRAPSGGHGQDHKRSQQEFFADAERYEREVVQSAFYRALDAMTVHAWIDRLPPHSRVLDIAAGTCRTSVPLAERGHHAIALDLSEELLGLGRDKARAAGVGAEIDLFLGDAESLSFLDESVDAALCHGALHHFEAPGHALAEAGRVLKPGGRWFSLDPNRSPLRWVFDLTMRVRKLWHEEAADHPPQTAEEVTGWCAAAGICVEVKYTCYILPHFVNWMSPQHARAWLRATDSFFSRVPPITRWAGVIYVEGIKDRGTARH
ncbi:MAG: methyltransferase domain-containing protein [Candidatus Rokuibacteriota bacterium]